jgi:DNA-binding NarL/FixJ family response regulator
VHPKFSESSFTSTSIAMVKPHSAIWRVLVLKKDRIYSEALQRAAEIALPGSLVHRAHSLSEARLNLKRQRVDLLLAGCDFTDGGVLPILWPPVPERGWRRALIVTARKEERLLELLRTAPIAGVFDPAAEDFARLLTVLPQVMGGARYWSPGVWARLREVISSGTNLSRRLTPVQLLVFAAVGDGSDDVEAGARLGMKPSAVKSVRNSLHQKLGLRHKGELMRLALEHGVVRITAERIHRPGFELLLNRQQRGRRDLDSQCLAEKSGVRPDFCANVESSVTSFLP